MKIYIVPILLGLSTLGFDTISNAKDLGVMGHTYHVLEEDIFKSYYK